MTMHFAAKKLTDEPPDPEDRALSAAHSLDSVNFHLRHLDDHAHAARTHAKRLQALGGKVVDDGDGNDAEHDDVQDGGPQSLGSRVEAIEAGLRALRFQRKAAEKFMSSYDTAQYDNRRIVLASYDASTSPTRPPETPGSA